MNLRLRDLHQRLEEMQSLVYNTESDISMSAEEKSDRLRLLRERMDRITDLIRSYRSHPLADHPSEEIIQSRPLFTSTSIGGPPSIVSGDAITRSDRVNRAPIVASTNVGISRAPFVGGVNGNAISGPPGGMGNAPPPSDSVSPSSSIPRISETSRGMLNATRVRRDALRVSQQQGERKTNERVTRIEAIAKARSYCLPIPEAYQLYRCVIILMIIAGKKEMIRTLIPASETENVSMKKLMEIVRSRGIDTRGKKLAPLKRSLIKNFERDFGSVDHVLVLIDEVGN